jgi:hypothetical protein
MSKILVGMLLLLLIAGCNADGDDLIVLQDGSHLTGTLQVCLNGSCQLSGRAIPQTTITWIGLHQARSNPPQPNDPAVAEIRMIDHSVHPGLMTAIDPTSVITVPGSYDRQKVAWVYLAHPAKTARDAPTTGWRVVRFDVDVAVTTHQHRQSRNGTAGLSLEDDSVDWTGSWQNVTLRIVPGSDGAAIALVPDQPFPTGVVQASAQFTYNDPPAIYQPTNCKGELPTQTYTGTIVLNSYLKLGGTTNKIGFLAQAQDGGIEFMNALGAVIKSRCRPGDFKVSANPGTFPFRTPDGIAFDLPLLTLIWNRASASASEMPFPLDEILAGKSFTLETGTQSRFNPILGSDAGSGDGNTVDEAVRVSFTAR